MSLSDSIFYQNKNTQYADQCFSGVQNTRWYPLSTHNIYCIEVEPRSEMSSEKHHGGWHDSILWGEPVILKVKLIVQNGGEKGWFFHKTLKNKTLKDVAWEILSGQNPCFDMSRVTEFLGLDDALMNAVKFDTFVTSVKIKQGEDWIESPVDFSLNWYAFLLQCFNSFGPFISVLGAETCVVQLWHRMPKLLHEFIRQSHKNLSAN